MQSTRVARARGLVLGQLLLEEVQVLVLVARRMCWQVLRGELTFRDGEVLHGSDCCLRSFSTALVNFGCQLVAKMDLTVPACLAINRCLQRIDRIADSPHLHYRLADDAL